MTVKVFGYLYMPANDPGTANDQKSTSFSPYFSFDWEDISNTPGAWPVYKYKRPLETRGNWNTHGGDLVMKELWQEKMQDGGRDSTIFWSLPWPSSQPRHTKTESHHVVCDQRRRRTSSQVRGKRTSTRPTYRSVIFCRTRLYHSMLEFKCG